jgi:hypothetical protein
MSCKTQDKCFNCTLIDFRDRLYWKFESEWYIQSLQDTTNRLKLLYDGYSQDIELEKIIQLLNNYTNQKIKDKTTNINELFQLETKLLTLVECCDKHPQRMEG